MRALVFTLLYLVLISSAFRLETHVFEPHKDAVQFTLMVVCGIHAREANYTRKVCNSIISDLGTHSLRTNYRTRVVVVPLANPDGYAIAAANSSMSCWRCNKNMVDLNRNFPIATFSPSNNTARRIENHAPKGSQEYPGPTPLSEWETRDLDAIMREYKPDMLISVHTGTLAIFPPYDFTTEKPPDYGRMIQVAHWLRDGVCPECFVGRSVTFLGYRAYGTLTDYAFYFLRVPLVYTLEVFDAPELSKRDEAPLTPSLCQRIFATFEEAELGNRWLPLFERIYSASSDIIGQLK